MEQILIPDRPQAREDTRVGQEWKSLVRNHAARQLRSIRYPQGFVQIQIDLYYSLPEHAPEELVEQPELWNDWSIPRGDVAVGILLTALKGVLYRSPSQVQPLTIKRHVMTKEQLVQAFGPECRRGCAVIRHGVHG